MIKGWIVLGDCVCYGELPNDTVGRIKRCGQMVSCLNSWPRDGST